MRKITPIAVAVIILIIAVYDVIAMAKGGREASISHILIEWGYKYPVFTFLMGFTMGHLFWRMRDTKHTKKISEDTDS